MYDKLLKNKRETPIRWDGGALYYIGCQYSFMRIRKGLSCNINTFSIRRRKYTWLCSKYLYSYVLVFSRPILPKTKNALYAAGQTFFHPSPKIGTSNVFSVWEDNLTGFFSHFYYSSNFLLLVSNKKEATRKVWL